MEWPCCQERRNDQLNNATESQSAADKALTNAAVAAAAAAAAVDRHVPPSAAPALILDAGDARTSTALASAFTFATRHHSGGDTWRLDSPRGGKGAFYTLVPIRPRSRCERRFLRTFPVRRVVTLHPSFPFNVCLTGETFD